MRSGEVIAPPERQMISQVSSPAPAGCPSFHPCAQCDMHSDFPCTPQRGAPTPELSKTRSLTAGSPGIADEFTGY